MFWNSYQEISGASLFERLASPNQGSHSVISEIRRLREVLCACTQSAHRLRAHTQNFSVPDSYLVASAAWFAYPRLGGWSPDLKRRITKPFKFGPIPSDSCNSTFSLSPASQEELKMLSNLSIRSYFHKPWVSALCEHFAILSRLIHTISCVIFALKYQNIVDENSRFQHHI